MSLRLEGIAAVGDIVFAALVETTIETFKRQGRVALYVRKAPIAVLIARAGATEIFDTSGTRIDKRAFDKRRPGVRAKFERLAIKGPV